MISKRITQTILLIAAIVSLFFVTSLAISQPVEAQAQGGCSTDVLGLPTWYKYLELDGNCDVQAPDGLLEGNIPWLIAAAMLEAILRITAYVAVAFVFVGGYQILASSGNPESVAGGRRKITAAIIGFIIAVTASAVVGFLMTELTGTGGQAGLPNVDDGGRSAVNIIFSLAYRIAAGLAVIYIAIAGIQFSTSGGDPGKVAKARNSVLYAGVGLLVVVFAVAIISFIGGQL